MKNNIKMALLLSAISFSSPSYASGAMDDLSETSLATGAELASSTYKAYGIGEATTRALATALGCIPAKISSGVAVADGNERVIPIASMVDSINTKLGTTADPASETGTVFARLAEIDVDTDDMLNRMGTAPTTDLTTVFSLLGTNAQPASASGSLIAHAKNIEAVLGAFNPTSDTLASRLGTKSGDQVDIFAELKDIDGDVDAIKNLLGTKSHSGEFSTIFAGLEEIDEDVDAIEKNIGDKDDEKSSSVLAAPGTTVFGKLNSIYDYIKKEENPEYLTRAVDKLMECNFSYDALSSTMRLNGSTSTPVAAFASPATVMTGSCVADLFNAGASASYSSGGTAGNAVNASMRTPAEKMSILLGAVFNVPMSSLTTLSSIDQEDSGAVMTAYFNYVLGTNRNGASPASNAFGVAVPMGRIKGTPNGSNFYKYGTSTYIASGPALNTPSAYFNAVIGVSTSASDDILRVKALIQDLVVS